jgi:hypothetical protein
LISVTAEAGTDYKTGFTTLVSSVQKLVEPDILNSWINNLTQLPKLVRGKGPAHTDTKIPTKLDPSQPAPSTSAFKLVRTDDDDKSLDAELESHSGHDSTTSFSNNRQYKLHPNTPMFMANGHTCDDWFFIFESQLDACRIPEDMILTVLSNYVSGTALQLFKTYMRSGGRSWDIFKRQLKNTFQPVDHDFRTRVKLTNLKQGNDSIDTYNKNF